MKLYFLFLSLSLLACNRQENATNEHKINFFGSKTTTLLNPDSNTLDGRVLVPEGFKKISNIENNFGQFLRNLPLLPNDSKVHIYNGDLKGNQNAHCAVIKMTVGNKDLQQCADAVMRLRAEYFYQNENYDKIQFHFTNGFLCSFSKWAEGYRIAVNGNNVNWVKTQNASTSRNNFEAYLETVFSYAGTLSLEKELKQKEIKDIKPGDVFIKGGSPGHAAIVVDVAKNEETGETLFLLAQSYMPAQEIHLLKNPNDNAITPWYSTDFGNVLITPEYTFTADQLREF
jgi:hypothetical protein